MESMGTEDRFAHFISRIHPVKVICAKPESEGFPIQSGLVAVYRQSKVDPLHE
jgi:hypothetical protein